MNEDTPLTPAPPPESEAPKPPEAEAHAAAPAEETRGADATPLAADVVTSPAPEPEAVVETPAPAPAAEIVEAPPAEALPPEPVAEEPAAPEEPAPPAEPEPPPSNKRWYVVKVQSGREETIKEAVERRVKIEGLEEYYGQIVIPVEKVVVMNKGKRVTRENKLYPGYLMVEVEYNDRILYLFRETSGVGDFVGASVTRAPVPMTPREVEQMLGRKKIQEGAEVKEVAGKAPVDRGDRVKIRDGTFAGMEGEVKEIIEAKSQVRVGLVIFGREVPVDLEYWQVEPV